MVLLGFGNHLYVNDPDALFFSSLPINLVFEAHGCLSKIGKFPGEKLGGVSTVTMIAGAHYQIDSLNNQPFELSSVISHPSHSVRQLGGSSFMSSYNLSCGNGGCVYFQKQQESPVEQEKSWKNKPS